MVARPQPTDEGEAEAYPRWMAEVSQVRAAILMVAKGPYPRITISNLVEGAAVAAELRDEAAGRGVELLFADGDDGALRVVPLTPR